MGTTKMWFRKPKKGGINRFVNVHKQDYAKAVKELKNGEKKTHWMWYIFPQIKGLGVTEWSEYYGLSGKKEALDYLSYPILKRHMEECCEILLNLDTCNPVAVFGDTDAKKLRSCMTLFYLSANKNEIYRKVLAKFFDGEICEHTAKAVIKGENRAVVIREYHWYADVEEDDEEDYFYDGHHSYPRNEFDRVQRALLHDDWDDDEWWDDDM